VVDSAEVEAREIADRLGIDFAELKERAQRNAEVEDWGILKQARFEAVILQEQAEHRQRLANREARDTARVIAHLPKLEEPPADPWVAILAGIDSLPNNAEGLERSNGHIKVRSTYLLTDVLGINREKIHHHHAIRLSKVMECLGWDKPPNVSIGPLVCKGYRKALEEI
jgi:hypothetical protein